MSPENVLDFWLSEVGPDGWYRVDDAVDDRCRRLFLPAWEALPGGGFRDWQDSPRGALAYLILADQFPRNMFRGDPRSFATDALARAAAGRAIAAGHDLATALPERQFFYLPFMHAEDMGDQERSVALFAERVPDSDHLLHARAHREVIRRFGRFPYRNGALGRASTAAEEEFLSAGAYPALVRAMREGVVPGA